MHHELLAMERQAMRERIKELERQLETIHGDFALVAKGVTPCLYCANDDVCVESKDITCNFVWIDHD